MEQPTNQKYATYIIDPDTARRMRLKGATASVFQFGRTNLLSGLDEARRRLDTEETVDVVFASYIFGLEELGQFFDEAKKLRATQDAAFVLVLPPKDQDASTVAKNVISGADGILFEPYSVNQLVEITQLAAQVKLERSEKRERAALALLLNDVANQVNILAYLRSLQQETGVGDKKLREMCHTFQTLKPESKKAYFEVILDRFADSPFPRHIYQKAYKGASKRVKDKMEAELLEKLKKEAESGA